MFLLSDIRHCRLILHLFLLPRYRIYYFSMESRILSGGEVYSYALTWGYNTCLGLCLLSYSNNPWFLGFYYPSYISSFYQKHCVTILISVTIHVLCIPSSLLCRLGGEASSLNVGSDCLRQLIQTASAILPHNSFLKELTLKTNLKIFLIQQLLSMNNYKFKLLKWSKISFNFKMK